MADLSVLGRGARLVRELVSLHPVPFAISVTGAMVYAAATVGSTIVLGRVTDEIVYPTFETGSVPAGTLRWGVLAVVAVTVLRVSGVVTRRFFAGMTSERVQRTVRGRLADKYLNLPLAWHARTPTGELLAHVDSDTEITTELLHPLPFSLGVVFLALFSAVSLLVVDPALAIVAFAIFPALTGMNQVYSRRVEKPAAAVQAGVGRVSSVAHESFDGALVVKTLGRAKAEGERFDEEVTGLRDHRIQVGRIRALFETMLDTLPNLGIILVLGFGAMRINSGAITRGDLVQVAALFLVLSLPMRVLGFFLEMVPPSLVARRRLDRVLLEADPEGPSDPGALPEGPLSLTANTLRFTYPRSEAVTEYPEQEAQSRQERRAEHGEHAGLNGNGPVLDGVDFAIAPGETVALVGSTGSGKSTLCHILTGLIPTEDGTVEIGGVELDRLPDRERSDAVALVFQESFLFGDTIGSNIDIAGQASPDRIRAAAEVAQIDEFVSGLERGYDTVVGERGVTLSGGQRQRVALARALLREPRLLILDDATSAVDPKIEQRILSGLRSELAMTALVVAQRVSTIQLADRVLYLASGRIAGQGSHQELMSLPGYAALVRAYETASR